MFSDLPAVLFSFQGVLLLIVFVLTLYITCNLFRDVRIVDLERKAVLITGCDSGFGYELAKKLDALGLRVFAACLTSDGEAKLSKECSRELRTFKLDVTKDGDVQKALEVVQSGLPSQGTVLSESGRGGRGYFLQWPIKGRPRPKGGSFFRLQVYKRIRILKGVGVAP